MFNDPKVKKQITIDTELMGYDWTMWRLKIAVRDMKKLRKAPVRNDRSRFRRTYNRALTEAVAHLQEYFESDIDCLSKWNVDK